MRIQVKKEGAEFAPSALPAIASLAAAHIVIPGLSTPNISIHLRG